MLEGGGYRVEDVLLTGGGCRVEIEGWMVDGGPLVDVGG